MSDPAFFGYGSLVNLATHNNTNALPARLAGWRRVWVTTGLRNAAFLSVEPVPTSVIDGIIAQVPGADWAALDLREAAYDRYPVTVLQGGTARDVAVYQVSPHVQAKDRADAPILRSYLDVVVQGFLQVYGEAGVTDFFATTAGWRSIRDDRADPQYPRHQRLSSSETALVDHYVERMMQDEI
ncbi:MULTISPECIES: gamma-glutamylcyclotransferase family protein [unclassified Yoonia]|uniref:gamma-glutamylcyclotransferase family protein n=1 Tax=unclassified Yoonia TaxID=2629118 RepID=UPI002AFE1F5E|nr:MULTISPECIES: gamma-glutamylcyclotransferase family protein [unclassified Yoonia]